MRRAKRASLQQGLALNPAVGRMKKLVIIILHWSSLTIRKYHSFDLICWLSLVWTSSLSFSSISLASPGLTASVLGTSFCGMEIWLESEKWNLLQQLVMMMCLRVNQKTLMLKRNPWSTFSFLVNAVFLLRVVSTCDSCILLVQRMTRREGSK